MILDLHRISAVAVLLAALALLLGTAPCSQAEVQGAFGVTPRSPKHVVYKGKPFFFIGKSAFALIDADLKTYIDEAHRDGFNVMRTWLCCPRTTKKWGNDHFNRNQATGDQWPFGGTPDKPDITRFNEEYFRRLDKMLDHLESKGMVAELTLFTENDLGPGKEFWPGGAYSWDEAKQRYVLFVLNRYRNRPNIYYEIANEYSSAEELAFVEKVGDFIWEHDTTHLITNSGSDPVRFAVKPWYRIHNIHPSRGNNWWLRVYDEGIRPIVRKYRFPVVNDEPMGSIAPDDKEKGYPGRDPDPNHHRINFWLTAMAGGYVTLHSHKGINALAGHNPGQEFVKPFRAFFEKVRFWEMEPADGIVKSGMVYALASPKQIVAYLPNGGSATLDLSKLEGTLKAAWYNPRDGKFGKAFKLQDGGEKSLTAPAMDDWALLIDRPKS